jgi:transposase
LVEDGAGVGADGGVGGDGVFADADVSPASRSCTPTSSEDLRALLALSGTHPDRALIRKRLFTFYNHAAASTSPQVHRLASTVEAWWPAILAAIVTNYSNARSEGYNRLAKHEGRNAFGFRNPVNQRRRIRWACTRQYRRQAAVNTALPG